MTNTQEPPHEHHAGGHERSCNICGTAYQARRSNSRYCSSRCVKRAQRKPKAPAPDARRMAGLKSYLIRRGLIGNLSNQRCGPTVSLDVILGTLQAASEGINKRGLRSIAPLTMPVLRTALSDMNCGAGPPKG